MTNFGISSKIIFVQFSYWQKLSRCGIIEARRNDPPRRANKKRAFRLLSLFTTGGSTSKGVELVHICIAHPVATMRSVVFVSSVSALAPWGSHFNYLNQILQGLPSRLPGIVFRVFVAFNRSYSDNLRLHSSWSLPAPCIIILAHS